MTNCMTVAVADSTLPPPTKAALPIDTSNLISADYVTRSGLWPMEGWRPAEEL